VVLDDLALERAVQVLQRREAIGYARIAFIHERRAGSDVRRIQ